MGVRVRAVGEGWYYVLHVIVVGSLRGGGWRVKEGLCYMVFETKLLDEDKCPSDTKIQTRWLW